MLVMPVLPVALMVLILIAFPHVWLAVPTVMLVVMVVIAVMMLVVMATVVVASLLLIHLHYILCLFLPLLRQVPAGEPLAARLYFRDT